MACCYRLDSVQVVAQGGLEDPLDKEEELQDQMDSLPYLCRFQYENTCTYITGLLDPTIKAFTSCEPDTPPFSCTACLQPMSLSSMEHSHTH